MVNNQVWRAQLGAVNRIYRIHGEHFATEYMIGEVSFTLLARAKTDPEAAAEVKECADRVRQFLHMGGLRDYLRSRNAAYRAARAVNPEMRQRQRPRAMQLLAAASRVLVESQPVDVAALPSVRQGRPTPAGADVGRAARKNRPKKRRIGGR